MPARAPFVWKYYEQQFDMEFVGGLVGIRQDPESLALRPEIGWAILDKQKLTEIRAEKAAKGRDELEAARARMAQERSQAAEGEKARVCAPPIDLQKPRFEQFFRFVCPFCGHGEEIGLWFTSKTCAGCRKQSRIVREP